MPGRTPRLRSGVHLPLAANRLVASAVVAPLLSPTLPLALRRRLLDLTGLPPLHVVAGADEVLLDDADRLVERARAVGHPVTYRRAEGMWHAFPVLAGTLREADQALAELGTALRADCAA